MTELSPKIVSPTDIFRLYVAAYRECSPKESISQVQSDVLQSVIESMAMGREVKEFRKQRPFAHREPGSVGPVSCSSALLDFLDFLNGVMQETRIFHVNPTRAIELMYNNAFDDERRGPDVLRLRQIGRNDCFELVSTKNYQERTGNRIALTLGMANDATDWTPLPQGMRNTFEATDRLSLTR